MTAQTKKPGDRLAFPAPYEPYGLTKRELFAAMAMQGILSHAFQATNPDRVAPCSYVAAMSNAYADALLAELAKDGAP